MAELETTKISDLGNMLEEPGCFLISSDEYYRMLLAALDLGWQVDRFPIIDYRTL